jgi:hypothetical protein
MPKYHVTIKCAGANIRVKNVEVSNQQDAEAIALKRSKESIKVVGSTIAVEGPNATQISGEELFKKFFR